MNRFSSILNDELQVINRFETYANHKLIFIIFLKTFSFKQLVGRQKILFKTLYRLFNNIKVFINNFLELLYYVYLHIIYQTIYQQCIDY